MTSGDLQLKRRPQQEMGNSSPSAPPRQRAFTVLELMLVMVVLAVLVTLVFSFSSRMKDRALTAACTAKMRQMGAAFHAYAGEHNNEFPVQEVLLPGKMREPDSWTHSLYPYTGSYLVMYCPTGDRVKTRNLAKNSYLYNSYVSLHRNPEGLSVVKRTASRESSKDVLLIDAYSTSTGSSGLTEVPQAAISPVFKAPWTWFPHSTDLSKAALHPSAIRNVLYVDGHVQSLKAVPEDAIVLKHWRWPIQ